MLKIVAYFFSKSAEQDLIVLIVLPVISMVIALIVEIYCQRYVLIFENIR